MSNVGVDRVLNVDNSCQKTCKIRYHIFEVLLNVIVSLYFMPNILSRIVEKGGMTPLTNYIMKLLISIIEKK